MGDDEWEELEALYNAECRYVDDQFNDLLSELDQRGYRDETLTLFTADHGELFGEHGKGGHPGEFWEGVIQVPLAISGITPETTVDGQARLLDIAPTIGDALGFEPTPEWSGESLLPLTREEDAIKFAFGDVGRDIDYEKGYVRRADGWKLLDHAEDGNYLFDISKTPAELSADEQSSDRPEVLAELQAEIHDHRDRMAQLRKGVRGVEEDNAMVEEHLENLGYL
jgi:arylsulfatase A-like enzyme